MTGVPRHIAEHRLNMRNDALPNAFRPEECRSDLPASGRQSIPKTYWQKFGGYRPRTSVKGKILADFIVERSEDDSPDTPMEAEEELPDPWILFTDGSSCVDGSRAGLILTDPEGA
ncbi:hypothetical protein Tco_0666879 [Tanacetum coccineum]